MSNLVPIFFPLSHLTQICPPEDGHEVGTLSEVEL